MSTVRDIWYAPRTLHVLQTILGLPEGRYELLLVSQRTMHLLNDYLARDVIDLRHWAIELNEHSYQTPDFDDAETIDILELVNRARLECMSMTNPIADGLQAIAAALAGQPGCGCAGGQTAPASGAAVLPCLSSVPEVSMLEPPGLQNDPVEQIPPGGFDTWDEYVSYKCGAAEMIWLAVDNLASSVQSCAMVGIGITGVQPAILGWAVAAGVALTPVAFVAICAGILSIAAINYLALSELHQFQESWRASKQAIVCAMFNSGSAVNALEQVGGFIDDAVQGIAWEGALAPFAGPLAAAVAGIMSQVEQNGLVNSLFELNASYAQATQSCVCSQMAWHFDAGEEGWEFTSLSDEGNSASGVWSEAEPTDAGDSSPGGLKLTATRVGVAGMCEGKWVYEFPLDRPVAHTGDVFSIDGYCDNSGGTYYQVHIIYLDDVHDMVSRTNPNNWANTDCTVTAGNAGKLIKGFQITAGVGTSQVATRHFAFDKAEYVPLS